MLEIVRVENVTALKDTVALSVNVTIWHALVTTVAYVAVSNFESKVLGNCLALFEIKNQGFVTYKLVTACLLPPKKSDRSKYCSMYKCRLNHCACNYIGNT